MRFVHVARIFRDDAFTKKLRLTHDEAQNYALLTTFVQAQAARDLSDVISFPTNPDWPFIAVVGCGYWGKELVRYFAELGKLSALVDFDKKLPQPLIEKHGVNI